MGAFVRDPATGIATWDDAAEATPVTPARSGAGEVATGLKRGAVVELPRMFGGALKATGQPGDTLYDAGQSIQDSAEARGMRPDLTRNPDKHNWFTDALAAGGEMVVPSMAGMAAAAPAAVLGAPAGAVLATGAVASGGLFGASQFQETYEHVKAAGGTDESAKKAGWLAGAIEAGGETVANFTGAKFAMGLGRGLKGATLDSALQGMRNPAVLKPFAGQYAKTLGVETGTEMAQNAGEAAVEQAYGVQGADPTAAAMDAVAPTFGMTTLLAPFGLHANMRRASQIKNDVATLSSTEAPADARVAAANRMGTLLDTNPPPGMDEPEWKKQVMDWRMTALEAANANQPIDVDSLLSASLSGRSGEFAAAAADQAATEARQAAQANIQPDVAAGEAALAGDQAQEELAPAQPTMTAQEAAQMARTQEVQQVAQDRAAQLAAEEQSTQPEATPTTALGQPAKPAIPVRPDVESAIVEAAKAVGVTATSAKAAARKLGTTERTPEAQAAEATRIADALEAAGTSENQVKALRAYAAATNTGAANGQATTVDQGAELQPGNPQNNAAVPQAAAGQSAQGNAASQPAQAASQESPAKAAVDTATPVTAEAAGLVDRASPPAAMNLVDQLTAAGATPMQPHTQESAQRNVPKPKEAKKDADVLAKKVKQLPEEDRAVAEKAWNNLRRADAKKTGAPADSYVIPEWANLPAEAQHIFATGEASDGHKLAEGQRYAAAKAAAIRVAGEQKAAEVNAEVDAANANDAEGRRREGVLGQITTLLRKIEGMQLSADRDAMVKTLQELHNDYSKREGKPLVPYAELRGKYGADLSSPRNAHTALMTALEVMPEQGKASLLMDMMGRMLDASEKLGFSAKLAKQLMSLYPEAIAAIKVAYSDKEGKVGADGHKQLGSYAAKTNTVTIFKGGENWHTVMHEVVHALTVHAMADAKAKLKAGQKSAVTVAYQNLEALHAQLGKDESFAGEYGMKSVEEFVAETMSSAMFQSKLRAAPGLANIKAMGSVLTDAFTQLIKALRTFLRLPERSGNALAQAISLSSSLIDLQNAGVETKASGKFDMAQSPLSAVQTVQNQVGGLTKAVDKWLNQGDFGGKGRRTAMYLASTKQIERWVKGMFSGSPEASRMGAAIKKWFAADDAATRARKFLTDAQYGHIEDMQAALDKAGKKYADQATLLAHEMSRLNLDLSKDFAANKALNKKLDDTQEMKDHVNGLHKMYEAMKGSQKAAPLIPLIHQGVLVNRKMYVNQTATLLVSALHAAKVQGATQTDPATAALTQFADRLDMLSPAKGTKVNNPSMFMDAKTEEMNSALEDTFAYVHQHFPGGDLHESIKMIEKFYKAAIANPYMHLGRSGRYMVRFEVKDTSQATLDKLNALLGEHNRALVPFEGAKRSVFMRFDDQVTMQRVFDALQKSSVVADGSLSGGAITDADAMDKAFAVSTAVGKLRKLMMEKYEDLNRAGQKDPAMAKAYAAAIDMVNSSLIDMMESSSARKMGARREGTPGYELDYLRNFSKRAEAYISTISNQYAAPKFAEAGRDMKEVIHDTEKTPGLAVKATEVYEELSARHTNAMSPVDSPIIDAIRTFGYHFYLSLSPAFIITNLMQPYHLTLPYVGARYGFVKTAKAMGANSAKAFKLVSGTTKDAFDANGWRGVLDARLNLDHAGLSAGEREFIEKLIASGVVDFTQAHEIGRMADGGDRRTATLAKTLGIASHYSEVVNRLTAGLTAYQMAGERVKAGTMSADEQFDYALEAVNRTQFNYSDHNTARALGRHGMAGKMTPLFMSFQQYAFQTMEHYIQFVHEGFLSKDPSLTPADRAAARKGLYGTLAMTGGIAGMLGLPFAGVLVALANGVSGDDDDVRSGIREWLAATFGADLGEIVARGAPRALGVDMSSRAGHADLVPGTRWLADRRKFEDKMKDGSQTMMGPAVNAVIDIAAGMGKVADGDIAGGVEAALPMALKGYVKAARLAQTGSFENKSGNAIPIPVEWNDLLAQAVGLTPSKKAEQSEANFYHQSQQSVAKQSKSLLKQEAVKAIENGDSAGVSEAMDAIAAYNIDHPDAPILGSDIGSTVTARVRGRAFAAASGTGIIDSNPSNMPKLGSYSWANTGIGR